MLIPVFILTVLLVAIAVLLWCLRGFTRTLKQQGFAGVLVCAQNGTKEQEPAQVQVKGSGVAKSSASPSRKDILRSGRSLVAQDTKLQTYATTPECGRQSHAVENAA